jgi:Lhr-like helicase
MDLIEEKMAIAKKCLKEVRRLLDEHTPEWGKIVVEVRVNEYNDNEYVNRVLFGVQDLYEWSREIGELNDKLYDLENRFEHTDDLCYALGECVVKMSKDSEEVEISND